MKITTNSHITATERKHISNGFKAGYINEEGHGQFWSKFKRFTGHGMDKGVFALTVETLERDDWGRRKVSTKSLKVAL